MGVEVIWSESYNGYQIDDTVVHEEVVDSGISPAAESIANQIYLRHSSTSKIIGCGLYITKYDTSYTGGATREADLNEILEWGNDSIVVLHVDNVTDFAVDDTITGSLSGATGTLIGVNATDNRLVATVTSGIFEVSDVVANTGSGSATVASITDAGIYVNQNYLDNFADYTVLNIADSSSFTVGLVVTGQTSGATATVIRIDTGKLIVSKVETGPFVVEQILDTSTGDSNVSSTGTEFSWKKIANTYGNDKTNAIPVTLDSVVGVIEAGQDTGEIEADQSISIKYKIVVPSSLAYTGLSAYTRQFSTAFTYII